MLLFKRMWLMCKMMYSLSVNVVGACVPLGNNSHSIFKVTKYVDQDNLFDTYNSPIP